MLSRFKGNVSWFVTVSDLTGEGIAKTLISFCVSTRLDLNNMVGLGLDGASYDWEVQRNAGMDPRIISNGSLQHCSSHSLSLAIGKANTVILGSVFSNLTSIFPSFMATLCEKRNYAKLSKLCAQNLSDSD
ncbi:hypothetical protein LOD99_15058 [Oopsacas minuta]|uniref:Uncharacterized protein n=1 Tax=Oopsacas minuta TaxID=111878 RepID=A0AAV7KDF2_9METZ|nr:hypothetical protein LOD99_15058 [Oopsacas minuta]